MKMTVHHWRFHDGKTPVNPGNRFGELIPDRGWYCWAYPEDNDEFEDWMDTHCPKTDFTWRFNSGDPMYTVYINDDIESKTFENKWIKNEAD